MARSLPKKTTHSSRLQEEMIVMDTAYQAFDKSIRAVMQEIQAVMKAKNIQQIGLGQGVPKRSHGMESKIVLVKMVLQDDKIALVDRTGESHRLTTLDTDAMHYLACRVRGSAVFDMLVE